MNPYETLGVDKKASGDDIKKAYRKRAQKAHPDRGGKKEEFLAVKLSYEILSDPSRRKQFDDHGESCDMPDPRMQAFSIVASMLMQMVDQEEIEYVDVVGAIRDNIKGNIQSIAKGKKECERKILKRERVIKRFNKKGAGSNLFAELLEGDIREQRRSIDGADRKIESLNMALDLLKEYSYTAEKGAAPSLGGLEQFVEVTMRGRPRFQPGWSKRY